MDAFNDFVADNYLRMFAVIVGGAIIMGLLWRIKDWFDRY